MVLPQIETRLRARYHAVEQVLDLLENIEETPGSDADHQLFRESLLRMEQGAHELATQHPDEAPYYREQAALFHEVSTWP